MATEATSSRREFRRREPSLRPVRWSGRLRPVTLLRAALVAAFLALAAGLIYAQEPATCAGGTSSRSTPSGDVPTDRRTGADPADADLARPAASGSPAGPAAPGGPAPGADVAAAAPSRPLPIPPGLVGVPVRLADPAAAEAVRPGRRVDLLAVPVRATVEQPTVLASAALVLDVLTGDAPAALVLALEPTQARRAVGQPETTRFAVVLR
jgi:hypothetical protein